MLPTVGFLSLSATWWKLCVFVCVHKVSKPFSPTHTHMTHPPTHPPVVNRIQTTKKTMTMYLLQHTTDRHPQHRCKSSNNTLYHDVNFVFRLHSHFPLSKIEIWQSVNIWINNGIWQPLNGEKLKQNKEWKGCNAYDRYIYGIYTNTIPKSK